MRIHSIVVLLMAALVAAIALGSPMAYSGGQAAAFAADEIPAPNHPIDFGYYYVDGTKYGDHASEVWGFTNLYILEARGSYPSDCAWDHDEEKCNFTNLRFLNQMAVARAAKAGKILMLLMSNEADWDEILSVTRDHWNRVKYIEMLHEEDVGVAGVEDKIERLKEKIRGLGLDDESKLYGVLEAGASEKAPSVEYVAIEGYVPPPGSSVSSENVSYLNALLDRRIAGVGADKQIVLVMQAYDKSFNWTNIGTLTDLQLPVYLKAYDNARVAAIAMFAYARGGGSLAHPELKQVHEQIGRKIQEATFIDLAAIDQGFILTRWSAREANGWFPQVAPNGRYVGYGFGRKFAVDLSNGSEVFLTEKGYGGGWLTQDTFTYFRELDDRGEVMRRVEARAGEWVPRDTGDPSNVVRGNELVAADGTWASWRAGEFRLTINGAVKQTGVGGALSTNQGWVAHASDPNNSAIRVWKDGSYYRDYPVKVPLHQLDINGGYLAYGGYGPVRGITPEGTDIDLAISPYPWEGGPKVFFVGGEPWVATVTEDRVSNLVYVLLRPFGAGDAIVVRAPAAVFDVVESGGIITLAYNTDKGALTVLTFSKDAPRYQLKITPIPPIPRPQPDTIDLVNAPNGSWFLAEGYSSGGPLNFRTDYSISNPNPDEVTVRVYFGDDHGQAFSTQFPIKAHSKRIIRLGDLMGMGAYSSVFQSLTPGSQIYVEREMRWSGDRAGHSTPAVKAPAVRWYFAEGSTAGRGYFQNYFLAFNPSPGATADLRVTYLRDRGAPVVRSYRIAPQQRLTLLANAEPELTDLSFGAVFESTNGVPILAERSMYWGPGWSSTPAATRAGGTNGMGASELSATWFFAEGAVFPGFDTYYLILNPNPRPVTVRLRYFGEGSVIAIRDYLVPANSRYTIDLRSQNLDRRGGNVGGVSAEVTSLDGSLIVAERATYRGNHPEWADGAVALGSNRGALKWHLPAERTSGGHDTFLLLMNRNAFDVTVRLTMNREDGTQVQGTQVLRAGTRTTLWFNDAASFPALAGQSFSTVVESLTPGGEITAEHAIYWLPEAGVIWQGGQGSAGIPE